MRDLTYKIPSDKSGPTPKLYRVGLAEISEGQAFDMDPSDVGVVPSEGHTGYDLSTKVHDLSTNSNTLATWPKALE